MSMIRDLLSWWNRRRLSVQIEREVSAANQYERAAEKSSCFVDYFALKHNADECRARITRYKLELGTIDNGRI